MPRRAQWPEKERARQQMTVPMARGHGLKKGLVIIYGAAVAGVVVSFTMRDATTVGSDSDWGGADGSTGAILVGLLDCFLRMLRLLDWVLAVE